MPAARRARPCIGDAMTETESDDELYLSTAAPSGTQQRLALLVFGASLALFVLVAPFARVQLAG